MEGSKPGDAIFQWAPTNTPRPSAVEFAVRNKTIISKRDLDAMIRMHVVNAGSPCDRVSPMPIVWKPRARSTCNWTIPGWTGHSESVRKCMDRINAQLRQLRRAYDIPEEQ